MRNRRNHSISVYFQDGGRISSGIDQTARGARNKATRIGADAFYVSSPSGAITCYTKSGSRYKPISASMLIPRLSRWEGKLLADRSDLDYGRCLRHHGPKQTASAVTS